MKITYDNGVVQYLTLVEQSEFNRLRKAEMDNDEEVSRELSWLSAGLSAGTIYTTESPIRQAELRGDGLLILPPSQGGTSKVIIEDENTNKV